MVLYLAGTNSSFTFFIILSIFQMVSNKILCHELKGEVFSSLMCVHCCSRNCLAVAWHPLPRASTSDLMSIFALLKYNLYGVPKSNMSKGHVTLYHKTVSWKVSYHQFWVQQIFISHTCESKNPEELRGC